MTGRSSASWCWHAPIPFKLRLQLTAKLYGQAQGKREDVGLFTEKRHLLARQLLPAATEDQLVALLMEAMRENPRKHLRGTPPTTVGELLTRETELEFDEAADQQTARRPAISADSGRKGSRHDP